MSHPTSWRPKRKDCHTVRNKEFCSQTCCNTLGLQPASLLCGLCQLPQLCEPILKLLLPHSCTCFLSLSHFMLVWPNGSFRFFIISYRKILMNILANDYINITYIYIIDQSIHPIGLLLWRTMTNVRLSECLCWKDLKYHLNWILFFYGWENWGPKSLSGMS